MLFLLEKQRGKGCKHSNKAILFRKMEAVAKKGLQMDEKIYNLLEGVNSFISSFVDCT